MERIIRALIVDDSAYIRKVLKQMLSRSPFIDVVATARDGVEALELVERFQPDVVTLDLMMPEMDGLTFLKTQMARRPVPVIIVSIGHEASETVLQALDAGAVDVVQKPTALATEKVFDISDELIAKVKALARAPVQQLQKTLSHQPLVVQPRAIAKCTLHAVVIGISTGGPQALKAVIAQLPASFSLAVAIVIHMPVGYTNMYARTLNEITPLHVAEAKEGDTMQAGTILIAPAGRHLVLRQLADGRVVTHIDSQPADTIYRPSVDILFQSAADVYHERVLGIVMTGMGSDGQQGAAWIKAHGGTIWTEAEESCVVYGMPRAVVEAGLSDQQIPLVQMAESLVKVCDGKDTSGR